MLAQPGETFLLFHLCTEGSWTSWVSFENSPVHLGQTTQTLREDQRTHPVTQISEDWRSSPLNRKYMTLTFLGDLNLEPYIMYNVWWQKSPIGIKRLNL